MSYKLTKMASNKGKEEIKNNFGPASLKDPGKNQLTCRETVLSFLTLIV